MLVDDCTYSCTKVIVVSDTFEELRKLIYYFGHIKGMYMITHPIHP